MGHLDLSGCLRFLSSQPAIDVPRASAVDRVPLSRFEQDRRPHDQLDFEPKRDRKSLGGVKRRIGVTKLDLRDLAARYVRELRQVLLADTEPVAGLQQQTCERHPNRRSRRDRDWAHACIERVTAYPAII